MKRMWVVLVIGFVVCILAGTGFADEPKKDKGKKTEDEKKGNIKEAADKEDGESNEIPAELKKKIDELIGKMASDEWKERQEVTKKLHNLLDESGEKQKTLLEYLEKRAKESKDPEVRWRCEKVLDSYSNPWKHFRKLRTLEGHELNVVSVAFSPDGKLLASASLDKTVRLWNSHTGKCLRTLKGHGGCTTAVAFSPDGKLLASAGGGDNTVRIWDPQTGKCMRTLAVKSYVYSVAFSPDGKLLASGSDDKRIRIWDPQTGKPLRTWRADRQFVASVAFSPGGKLLASVGFDPKIRLWNPRTGKSVCTFKGGYSCPGTDSMAFDPDGKLLACMDDRGKVHIYATRSGKSLREFTSSTCFGFNRVTWSPDGKLLVLGVGGGTKTTSGRGGNETIPGETRIYDARTGAHLRTLEGVGPLVFSPDGWMLASGSGDRTIIIWGKPGKITVHTEPRAKPKKNQ